MVELPGELQGDPDFLALRDIWLSARGDAKLPKYNDVHLELLGEGTNSVSVFKWTDRDTMTYLLHGRALYASSGVDLTGENLFASIHESRVEAVKGFDEKVVMTPGIGVCEFSVHMKSGLTLQRRMCIFPATAADPGSVYMIAIIKDMSTLEFSPIEVPVEYCRAQFDAKVFEIDLPVTSRE